MNRLKEIRTRLNITQRDAANKLNMSRRSYQYYELDTNLEDSEKYIDLCRRLENELQLDEEHGILDFKTIKEVCSRIFRHYSVTLCYLIGSYAKNSPKETSDVNLVIDGDVIGYDYYSLSSELRKNLKKRITLLRLTDLEHSFNTIREILYKGIKIY